MQVTLRTTTSIAVAALGVLLGGTAAASPTCTSAPKEKWQNQDAFKKNLETEGYKIKVFKVTKGQCYEIYGTDKTGKKVEIYFDPETGKPVESK